MSVNYHRLTKTNRNIKKVLYQPIFPLVYSSVHGPYDSLVDKAESIQKNFENLLLTNPGEWPMNPDLGIGVKRYLFENYASPELGKVEERIRIQLQRYLPFPYIQFISANFVFTGEDQDQGFATLQIKYVIMAQLARLMEITRDLVKIKDIAKGKNSYIGSEDFEKLKNLKSNLRNV